MLFWLHLGFAFSTSLLMYLSRTSGPHQSGSRSGDHVGVRVQNSLLNVEKYIVYMSKKVSSDFKRLLLPVLGYY